MYEFSGHIFDKKIEIFNNLLFKNKYAYFFDSIVIYIMTCFLTHLIKSTIMVWRVYIKMLCTDCSPTYKLIDISI